MERGMEPEDRTVGEWSMPEFTWVSDDGRVLRVIRAPLAWLVWPPAIPIARRRGAAHECPMPDARCPISDLRPLEERMSITWEFKREAEWQATIGGRTYAVFRRPICNPGKGEALWAWMDLDVKRPSACGTCATFEEAKQNAVLDGMKTGDRH